MANSSVEELLKKKEAKYKSIFDEFEIGQNVELESDSYEPELPCGAMGEVLDKNYSQNGCNLRIDFSGYETWIDAEDVF